MLSSRMLIWNVSSRNIKSAIEHFCCTKSIRAKSICLAGSQFDSLHVVFPVELNRNSIRWKRIEFELVFSPCTSTLYPRNIWAQLGHDSVSFSNFISAHRLCAAGSKASRAFSIILLLRASRLLYDVLRRMKGTEEEGGSGNNNIQRTITVSLRSRSPFLAKRIALPRGESRASQNSRGSIFYASSSSRCYPIAPSRRCLKSSRSLLALPSTFALSLGNR